MFKTLFKNKSIIDDNTKKWIFDTFLWTFDQFEHNYFTHKTVLVLPTNAFYEGKVSSVHEMAKAIFDNTLRYAGMNNWPIVLVKPQALPTLAFENGIHGEKTQLIATTTNKPIEVTYNPSQINQPQDLIASFSQTFASILISHRKQLPPGGEKYLPQAIDLVASFLGFGIMLSNTAYQFKGGCGSCHKMSAHRNGHLAEAESLYCLAIFVVLKQMPLKQVTSHLKSHLRKDFKNAYKEINQEFLDSSSVLSLMQSGNIK